MECYPKSREQLFSQFDEGGGDSAATSGADTDTDNDEERDVVAPLPAKRRTPPSRDFTSAASPIRHATLNMANDASSTPAAFYSKVKEVSQLMRHPTRFSLTSRHVRNVSTSAVPMRSNRLHVQHGPSFVNLRMRLELRGQVDEAEKKEQDEQPPKRTRSPGPDTIVRIRSKMKSILAMQRKSKRRLSGTRHAAMSVQHGPLNKQQTMSPSPKVADMSSSEGGIQMRSPSESPAPAKPIIVEDEALEDESDDEDMTSDHFNNAAHDRFEVRFSNLSLGRWKWDCIALCLAILYFLILPTWYAFLTAAGDHSLFWASFAVTVIMDIFFVVDFCFRIRLVLYYLHCFRPAGYSWLKTLWAYVTLGDHDAHITHLQQLQPTHTHVNKIAIPMTRTDRIQTMVMSCIHVLTVFPMYLFGIFVYGSSTGVDLIAFLYINRFLLLVRMPGYIRSFDAYFDDITTAMISLHTRRIMKFSTCIILVLHWVACFWWLVGISVGDPYGDTHQPNPSWIRKEPGLVGEPASIRYLYSLYWSVTTISTNGLGDITPTNRVEMVYSILVALISAGIYGKDYTHDVLETIECCYIS